MTTPKSVKIASIVSLAAIAIWLLAITLIDIFQDSIASRYIMTSFVGESEHIFLASTGVYIISAAVIAVCNVLMINGKTTIIPLAFSASAAVLTAPVANILLALQMALSAHLQGADTIARISAVAQITGYASYIMNAAFLCTVAASAVYGYVRKKGSTNEQ